MLASGCAGFLHPACEVRISTHCRFKGRVIGPRQLDRETRQKGSIKAIAAHEFGCGTQAPCIARANAGEIRVPVHDFARGQHKLAIGQGSVKAQRRFRPPTVQVVKQAQAPVSVTAETFNKLGAVLGAACVNKTKQFVGHAHCPVKAPR